MIMFFFFSAAYMKAYTECQEFFKNQAGLDKNSAREKTSGLTTSFDDKNCQIILYTKQSFQGFSQKFSETALKIQPLERSLRTIGPCCWRIVRYKNFFILSKYIDRVWYVCIDGSRAVVV